MIARELGFDVSGTDANVYPPMSTLLEDNGIILCEGYRPQHLDPAPDLVIVGNAMSRGNPMVEYLLDRGIPYTSGPQWLAEHVLQDRWVLAVAGTHGKTTTTSMLAWILEDAGLSPGFLIGGVAENFGISARLGASPFFVIEADEYDTAFFDKRSKFVHYRPRTAILNNLEFDHADIFDNLEAIKRQFHYLIRTIPGTGMIIHPQTDENLRDVVTMGCWSETTTFGDSGSTATWKIQADRPDYQKFTLTSEGRHWPVKWSLIGKFNALNAAAAILAARHAGVAPDQACKALSHFKSVRRRLQKLGEVHGVTVYDDFAHHPTAIEKTLEALRQHVGKERIIAVLEPRSNTMRMGIHQSTLGKSLTESDLCLVYKPENLDWDLEAAFGETTIEYMIFPTIESIIQTLKITTRPGDHILIMSNGGFGGIHEKLLAALETIR